MLTRCFPVAFLVTVLVGCTRPDATSHRADADKPQQRSSTGSARESDPVADIQEAYSQFSDALTQHSGDTATDLTSRRTIEFYERCRRLALDSSGVDFDDLTQFEIMLIFQLRFLLGRRDLESMNGHDVFRWGVQDGMVKLDVTQEVKLDHIQIEGDVAFATLRKDGQPVKDAAFRFVREEGHWKFDLFFIANALETTLEKVRKDAGKSKIELAVFLLEKTHGEPIPVEIVAGPLK